MKGILYLTTILVTSLFLISPAVCWSDSPSLQQLLIELKQTAAQTRTLSSSFVQEKNLTIFSEKLLSQGRFFYQSPDSLRWELLSPVASGFVLRGNEGERWHSLSKERDSFLVDQEPIMGLIAQQLLAWARVDLEWLQKRYRMELVATSPASLRLIPLNKNEAGFIDYLQVQFSEDHGHIAEILMVEQGGDSTLLRFTDVQLNKELPSAPFQPPEF